MTVTIYIKHSDSDSGGETGSGGGSDRHHHAPPYSAKQHLPLVAGKGGHHLHHHHHHGGGAGSRRWWWSAAGALQQALSGGPVAARSGAERSSITASSAAVLSGVVYSLSSAALTLLNKKVMVGYDFTAVHTLLTFHCAVAVALVKGCAAAGWAEVEPLSWDLVRLWMPVNLIFVAMLATNFYALALVGVGMVSVLKNLSNVFIIAGDLAFFGRSYSWHVWVCLGLMAASVVAGGATDAHFSWAGYSWQMANNVFTAGYALYLSRVTERAATATAEHRPLNQMSMVYYNNLLSMPLTLGLALLRGELAPGRFWAQTALSQPSFQAVAVASGLLGFLISFSSIWFVSLTTATFYSLVGSFNKVLVAAAGIWWFHENSGLRNLASIAAGLLAGTMLPLIKMRVTAPGGAGGGGGGPGGGPGGGGKAGGGGGS